MNNLFRGNHLKPICWLAGLLMAAILSTTEVSAMVFETYDSEGMPVYIDAEVKKNPDRFIDSMKAYLKQGNLDGIGFLGKILVKARPENTDVRAMYSMYLVSKGELEKAGDELDKADAFKQKSQFALYARAMILQREKKYDSAIKVCKQSIAMDKRHPYPRNILGRIYFDRGQYQQALDSFKKAVELEPDFLPGYTNLGAVSFILGDHGQSIGYFQRAIQINPAAYRSYYGLALVYENVGNNALAVAALGRSLELNPGDPAAIQKLGEVQLKAGKYTEALETGRQMQERGLNGAFEILGDAALHLGDTQKAISYLEKAPAENPAADYLLGYCFMIEGQYEKALDRMESAQEKNNLHFGSYAAGAALKLYLGKPIDLEKDLNNQWDKSLGKLLSVLTGNYFAANGHWAEAVKNWQSAEGLIRGFSIAGLDENIFAKELKKEELRYLNLGILYYFKNLQKNALSEFEKALNLNKDSIWANYWAAQVYLKKGDRDKALKFMENAVNKAPTFFNALYTIGELNFLKQKTETAAQYYKRALGIKKDAGILIKLGLIYENTGEYKKAERQYETVTRLFPNLFIGYNQLAWLYAKRGVELEKALKLSAKADELQPGNASINDTIGWIYFQKKEYNNALKHLEKADNIGPNNPTILYHLGAVYHAKGERKSARETLKKALEISSKFEDSDAVHKLLKELE